MSSRNSWLRIGFWAFLIYWFSYWLGLDWLKVLVKPLPVFAMGVSLLSLPQDAFTRRLRNGLFFCAAGDLAIEFNFLLGLAVFLLGHLWYIGAFAAESLEGKLSRAILPALFGFSMYRFLQSGLGEMASAVWLYTVVICAMLWRGAALLSWRRPWAQTLLIGAICFALSDSIIAIDKFYAPVSGARYWIMLLYWFGQWQMTQAAAARNR
jgi:alkenylglycerophosphocholine/alkenylglycerophosphoethanolamine hydrolase